MYSVKYYRNGNNFVFHFQMVVHRCIIGEPISEKMEYDIISNLGIHSTNKIDIFYTTRQTTA